jgi:hypothetical protein
MVTHERILPLVQVNPELRNWICGCPVLDVFQGRGFWFDFLCPESQAGKFGQKFAGRSAVESSHAQEDSGVNIFSQIVDV